MSGQPRTVPIPATLRDQGMKLVQARQEAEQRVQEWLELTRGVLADFGTPVAAEQYDLFNLQVGFVLREQPSEADSARLDAAERKRQRKREMETQRVAQRNGVAVAQMEEEDMSRGAARVEGES